MLFLGPNLSRTWYDGDAFEPFACDSLLEYCTRIGYNQRSPLYVCSPWWAVEVWYAEVDDRWTRFAICTDYLRAYNLGPIVPKPTPLSMSNFSSFYLGAPAQAK